MEENVGRLESFLRVFTGGFLGVSALAIIFDYIEAQLLLAPILALLSLALIFTGFTGKCRLYKFLGVNTSESSS